MVSAAEKTKRFLNQYHSIRDCLQRDVINYAKLARFIMEELNLYGEATEEAVRTAARRYAHQLREDSMEDRVQEVLAESEVQIRDNITVFVVSKYGYYQRVAKIEEDLAADALFYAVEGAKTYTLITAATHRDLVEDVFDGGFKTVSEDLALVTVTSPEKIEGTPGVVAYLTQLLADRDINIVELLSCWTDTLLVVDREDVGTVMDTLTLDK